MTGDLHWFRYSFRFPDGKVRKFSVTLDESLKIRMPPHDVWPDWTKLSYCQCEVCPLKEKEHPHCPIAVSLVEVIEFFKDSVSVEVVDVEIEVPSRSYVKKQVPLSQAVSGLIGILMATGGCPILGRLKPMVRTHLPFASLKETTYRTLGMYLLGQYFRMKRGKKPDWELEDLVRLFEDIRQVNKSFCRRLHAVCGQDANLNAVVRLDCFADNSSFLIQKKGLEEIEASYDEFFRGT